MARRNWSPGPNPAADQLLRDRPTTSGVGKINKYFADIYIPPYNNTNSPHLYIVTIPIDSTH